MNPSSKGWIRKYISILDHSNESLIDESTRQLSPEEVIYSHVQPTGLLYGHPKDFIFISRAYIEKLIPEEAFKVLLLEGLILIDHLDNSLIDISSIESVIYRFVDFYEKTNLEKAKQSWLDFSKLDIYGKLESIINQRVEIKGKITNRLAMGYLFNSLLFHDLLLFKDYLENKPGLDKKREQIMLDIVKVVACAANADGIISDEERSIFKLFLASANFDSSTKELAESFIKSGISLDEISFEFESSWLLKRYILEIAILTIWSDKELSSTERNFLLELTRKLELPIGEKDKSFIAIQSFILADGKKAHFLKGKHDIELILSAAAKRWTKILSRNKDKLANELKESKELVSLIRKSTVTDLTKSEKEKVKVQLADLGKTIPALTLFMLPGGAIILPLVLKIIPNLIPSAFRENQIKDKFEEGD